VLPNPTTVVIVDDHELIRRGLATFLELTDDIEVIAQAANGAEGVRMVRQLQPCVVLMDLVMPELDGVAAIRTIREAAPDTQVIALTSHYSDDLVLQALQAGAIGYLLKDISAMGLADAIRAAHAGRSTLAPHAAQAVIKHTTAQTRSARGRDLTGREVEVLRLMIGGLTNAQIAQRLTVSRATINFHVSSILGKLGAETRTKAVALALQDRLVA
jgi:two-component system, NarL family, response regulator LiaR